MRVKIANPATINAFFTKLRNKWHESADKRIQAPIPPPVSFSTQPQKDDFKSWLARDVSYAGIEMNDAILEKFSISETCDRLRQRCGASVKTTACRHNKLDAITSFVIQTIIVRVTLINL